MRNTRLVLIKAKRLMVRGINHFEVNFSSLYQIILGTNGSGKSYILSELSPLPASAKMFGKGGRKEYYCEHNGSKYELISTFDTPSGRHNFIVDGVDLNENGTATIQNELVKKHFNGLTQELFKVLTFRKFFRFTEMDANKRRQWMMTLSGIDLDWAMDVYQALRTRSRDASGHVKRINQKLTSTTQVALEDGDIERMELRLKQMQSDFTEALRLSKTGTPTLEDVEKVLAPKLFQLAALNNDLDKFMSKLDNGLYNFGITSKGGLTHFINTIGANLELLDSTLSKAYEDKLRVDGELSKLIEMGAEGLDEYKQIISALENELSLVKDAVLAKDFGDQVKENDLPGMYANLDSLSKYTTDVLANLFDNSTNLITLQKTDEYRNKEQVLLANISALVKKIEMLKHRIEHSKDTTQVECPSCSFIFKPGFHGSFEEEAPKALVRFEEELKDSQKQLREVHEYLNDVQTQVTGLQRFDQVATMYSGYTTLWEKIGEFGIETRNPKLALSILNDYIDWIKMHKHLYEISSSLNEKQKVYEQALQIDTKDMEVTRKQANDLEILIEDTLTKMDELRKKREALQNLLKTINEIEDCLNTSEILVNEIDSIIELEDDSQANYLLNDVLKTLQKEIESLEYQVSTIRVQQAIVEDLKVTLVQAKFEQDMYKFFADEISPTDGLIADVLKTFIESFVTNQTNIIESIWSYPMKILPCISSKEGLDYKFPIRVFGSNLPIPDIAEGSDAQVDVIDFSFVIMLMNLLGMEDFPLYLDEPISRMDELHRIEMIRIIQSMVESNQCSQMFFISHFAAQHGSFPESETLVMDSSNIVNLPTIFNKHCVIK